MQFLESFRYYEQQTNWSDVIWWGGFPGLGTRTNWAIFHFVGKYSNIMQALKIYML